MKSIPLLQARGIKRLFATALAAVVTAPGGAFAANHREAPITALDRAADITDWYSFVSYDDPSKVTFILNVDPLLEPSNGPHYFPFDPGILYEMKIDNNNDATEDITFQFRFFSELRNESNVPAAVAEGYYASYVGIDTGRTAPAAGPLNVPPGGPAGVPAGTQIIPPAITALDGPGSEGLALRQTYTVVMLRTAANGTVTRTDLTGGRRLFVLPTNVGPRTMPNYQDASSLTSLAPSGLFAQAIYDLGSGVKVFSGTVDDPFWIDLGAAFDTLNFRVSAGAGVAANDATDNVNVATDDVSGFNVNSIALEVPITMLTRTGNREAATSSAATIGSWGTTSRQQLTVRRTAGPASSGEYRQIQRMGNPLINELYIGTGFKDRFSMSQPRDDAQYRRFQLDPYLPRQVNALFPGIVNVPDPPRNDLLPLYQYLPPVAAPGTTAGPFADLLRLNTGVPPTPRATRTRLGLPGILLRGDAAAWPNGRRVRDDVVDIFSRIAVGVLNPAFNKAPNNLIGDGVNVNDTPQFETFPYTWFAHSGRDSRHIDTGETPGPVTPQP